MQFLPTVTYIVWCQTYLLLYTLYIASPTYGYTVLGLLVCHGLDSYYKLGCMKKVGMVWNKWIQLEIL